jgi:hypothetical protein
MFPGASLLAVLDFKKIAQKAAISVLRLGLPLL